MIHAKIRHLNFLQQEVRYKKIAEQISNKLLQSKIDNFQKMLIDNVCSDVPNAFWHRKKHIVDLPYVKDFNIKKYPHQSSSYSNVSPLKITTPVQTAATDAPASSSTKNVAPSTKSKKKSSPLDAIRNDPDALYALLSKMVKDDETPNSDATNSDDGKTSQVSVSKDPYYQI